MQKLGTRIKSGIPDGNQWTKMDDPNHFLDRNQTHSFVMGQS